MKISKWFYLLVILGNFSLHAAKKSEIVIRLKAPNQLMLVHMENMRHDSELISEEYVQDLQRVLYFDLNHNGRMRSLLSDEIKNLPKSQSSSKWRSKGVSYIFSSWVRDQYLTLSVLSTSQDQVCFAQDIKLSGNLNQDRQKIHASMGNFHEEVFHEKGIYQSKILYSFKTRNVSDPYYTQVPEEIYQCDYDGANPTQMTFENSHCITPHPTQAKNGQKNDGFFYVSYKNGQPKIYWNKFNQQQSERLCYIPGNQFMPCMSQQGDKVIFINDAPGHPEVFLQEFKPGIGAIGKPRQIYSCRRGVQASPVFSPDGKRIAFVSDQSGSPRIYVMDVPPPGANAQDLKPAVITRENRENTKPAWSPDGTKLAYISRVEGVRQVWIYDFITNQERQLTQGPTNKENPQWALNNLHLLFNSVGNDSCELYLVNLNQPKAIRLKTEPGIKRFPVWMNS